MGTTHIWIVNGKKAEKNWLAAGQFSLILGKMREDLFLQMRLCSLHNGDMCSLFVGLESLNLQDLRKTSYADTLQC